MRKEFGKWILDIAKYLVTVLLLSTIFSDMGDPLVFASALIGATICLVLGLLLCRDDDNVNNNNKKKQNKNRR